MTNAQDNAFPLDLQLTEKIGNGYYYDTVGLTKREYMATHIMAGLISDPNVSFTEKAVQDAVRIADMLIQELNK